MVQNNNLIIKNSLILYLRLFIISVTGLLASRYILEVLGSSDFGLYSVVGGLVFIMAFLNDVMVTSTFRFISYELGKNTISSVNKIFNISLVIHIVIGAITLSLGETIGVYLVKNYITILPEKLSDALFIFRCSIFSTVFSIVQVPFRGLLIAKEKFVSTSIVEIVRSVLRLLSVLVLFLYDGNKLRLFALLNILIALVSFSHYYIYCFKEYYNYIKWKFNSSFLNYKKILSFSFWTMFGATAHIGEIQGNALIINNFYGTILNASFSIANQVNNLVKTFAQNINKAVIPQITKNYSSGNSKRTTDLVIYSCKFSYFSMLFIALPILMETNFLVELWLSVIPNYTVIFIQIMIINALISTTTAGIPSYVQATGEIKYFQIILSIVKLSGLPISYLLLKLGFEPYFILISFTFIGVISVIATLFFLNVTTSFNVKYFLSSTLLKILNVTLMTIPLICVSYIFDQGLFRFLLSCFISTIWLVLSIYFLGIDEFERIFLKNKFIKYLALKK